MADLTLRLVKGSPLTNAEVDANFSNLNEAITAGGEPMGHADRAQSTLSFDAGTRTVSIAPVSGSFTVWVKGNKFDFTTAQTVVIPDTTGLHYVFFDASGVLSTRMAYFDWPNEAPTAYVAWNSDTGAAPFFADERHGVTLDWQTHEYLHRTRGAALANGFSLSNYSVVGDGSSDAHAQLDLSGGTFFDEDLQVDITPSNTPTANTWEQDLTGPAQIPVMYRSGSGWVRDTVTNFVLKAGTATPRYNTQSGGVWGLTDVPNNSYSSVCILATNNLTYPVVAIMGQHADSNISDIEDIDWADLNLDGFPAVEFRPLYKIVFQCSTSYSNTIKARFVKVFDKRNIVASSPAATIGSSHGGLSGLGADDHLQYLHITEVRSPSQAVKNSFLPAQTGNNGKFLTTDGLNPSWATMTAPNNGTLTLAVSGTGLSGSASFTADQAGNSTFVVTSNATSANTAGAIVARDGSGNFSANVITANSFSGSASGLTGFKTVNGNNILGAGNIQIDGGVTSFNARTGAITLSSADVTGALGFTPYNSTNPNGYTTNLGTVVGVTAGTGLTGGTITSSGTISLATSGVAAGTYTKVTVDVYGRATTGTSLSSSDVTTALGYTPPQPTGTGASGTWGISITGNAATVTNGVYKTGTNTVAANIVFDTTANNWTWQEQASGGNSWYSGPSTANFTAGANKYVFSSSGNSGTPELLLERGTTKLLEVLQANLQYKSNVVLHAGNYTSYSPTLTGGGASGTWGINITGNAASVSGISASQFFNNMGNNHSTYTDFNSIPNFGAYYVQAGTNSPTGVGGHQWYGVTLGLGNNYAYSQYASQLYWPRAAQNSDTYIYVRDRESGSWGSWRKARAGVADSIVSQANSATITASTGVNGSHIVQRDGNGYIYANHINFSTSESENPTINSFITSNGDGWSRKSSLAHVKNSIRGVADGTWAITTTADWLHSDRDFPSGTLITTNINYAVTYGEPFVLEIRGNSYGNIIPFDIQYQGYIYADTIINHGGYSNGTSIGGLVALNVGGNLCFWFPNQSYWHGYNVRVYVPYGGRQSNRVTSITGQGKPSGTKEVVLSSEIRQSLHSGNYTSYAAASAAGGCVVENGQTISANYTMTSGKNGMSAGPITIASGITVTIPSGSSWSIV